MDWHRTPNDDAWKQAHLQMLVNLNMNRMLRCDHCAHTTIEDPRLFAARHNLDLLTPMLTVSRRLRCTKCEECKGKATPEPSSGKPRD
jgi:predicted adenine nucleotide alpha hydrolase (AANH) superfamily ATPase